MAGGRGGGELIPRPIMSIGGEIMPATFLSQEIRKVPIDPV